MVKTKQTREDNESSYDWQSNPTASKLIIYHNSTIQVEVPSQLFYT